MKNNPTQKDYLLDTNCRICDHLKLMYELEDRQYYFGCESNVGCIFKDKEEQDRSKSDTIKS